MTIRLVTSTDVKTITPITNPTWVKSKANPSSETGTALKPGDEIKADVASKATTIDFSTSTVDNTIDASASTTVKAITGGKGYDVIIGSSTVKSTLTAGAGGSDMTGGAGDDKLIGAAGDDNLSGGAGKNTLTGGAGNNTFFSYGTDKITDLTSGDDLYVGSTGVATATVTGDFVANSATSNDGKAIINAAGGKTVNLAHAGHGLNGFTVNADKTGSTLIGSSNADSLVGAAGNDSITGGIGNTLTGGKGDDTFNIVVANNTITDLGVGSDVLIVTTGITVTATSPKGFTATTATTVDGIANISGVKTLDVTAAKGAGTINLTGSAGKDTLAGSSVTATSLTGGDGTDKFVINGTHNTITDFGKGGDDLVVNASASISVAVTADWAASKVTANNGTATFTTLASNVDLTKAIGPNGFTVDAHLSTKGLALTGGASGATIIGGTGADTITGGTGVNVLTGGAGADTFVFAKGNVLGNTTITDFVSGTDILDISAKATKGLTAGTTYAVNDHVVTVTTGTVAKPVYATAAQFVYDSTTGNLSFEAASTKAPASLTAPVLIEILGSHPALVGSDIHII